MKTKKHDKLIHILAFILPALIALIGLIIGGFAPFGDNDVFTACTSENHLTYYYELYDRIANGQSSFSSNFLGETSIYSATFFYYLSDPLNLIVLLFPRVLMPSVFSFLYTVKVGFAGLFFSFFIRYKKTSLVAEHDKMENIRSEEISIIKQKLQNKKNLARQKAKMKGGAEKKDIKLGGGESPRTKLGTFLSLLDLPLLAFSTVYALSGYLLGLGMNPSYTSVVALLPLLILGLEKIIREKKSSFYIIIQSLIIICNFYLGLVAFIFVLFYFFFYDFTDFSSAFHSFLRKLFSDLITIGITAFMLVPIIFSKVFTDNLSLHFPLSTIYCNFFDAFKQLLTNVSPSQTTLYGYGIDIYSGIFSVLLFLLFIFNPNIKKSFRIRMTLLYSLVFCGTFVNTINYIFNGFHHTAYNSVAFGFVFVFLNLYIGYNVLVNIEHTSVKAICLSTSLISVLIVLSLVFSFNYDSAGYFINSLEALLVFFLILLLYRSESMTKSLFRICFSVAIIFEIILTFTNGTAELKNSDITYSDTLSSKYYEAATYIHSTNPDTRIYIYDSTTDSNPISFMLYGYDYVIAKAQTRNVGALLSKIESYNGIDIYKNPYALHGFFSKESTASYSHYDVNTLASYNLLCTEYLAGDAVFTTTGSFSPDSSYTFYDKNGMKDIHNANFFILGTVTESGDYYRHFYTDQYIGTLVAGEESSQTISFPMNDFIRYTSTPYFSYKFDKEAFLSLFNKLSSSTASKHTEKNSIIYEIISDSDGYYTLDSTLLPHNTTVYVNGIKVSTSLFMNSFLVLPVKSGSNTIEIRYNNNTLLFGSILSLLSLTLFIFVLLKERKKETSSYTFMQTLCTKIIDFITDNYVYVTVIAISSIIFLIGMMITQSMPFGRNILLVGDGYVQDYFSYINSLNELKKNGLSLLDYSNAFYRANTSALINYLTNPFDLVINYFMPERFYLFNNILQKFVYLILSGPSLILYLTNRKCSIQIKKTDSRLIAIGVAYSLSNYAIGFFIYNSFTFLFFVPLIILSLERLIYEKKPLLYILLLSKMMGNVYYAFLLCEFLLLYFFTFKFTSVKDFFNKGVRFALSSIIAACMQGITLLPFYLQTRASSYSEDDAVLPALNNISSPLKIINQLYALTVPTVVDWDSSISNIYCGVLIVLLFPLAFLLKDKHTSNRRRRILLLFFLLLGLIYEPLNYILHGFHNQSGVPNRFSAFIIFLLMCLTIDTLCCIGQISKKKIILSVSTVSALLLILLLKQNHLTTYTIINVLLLVGYLTIITVYVKKANYKIMTTCVSLLLVVEVIISSVLGLYYTIGTRDSYLFASQKNLQNLSTNTDIAEDFVMTEYINNSTKNYSQLTASESISAFASDITVSHTELTTKWNILNSSNVIYYLTGNPLADLMLRLKYHVVDIYDEEASSNYTLISTSDNYEVYENPHFLSLGVFFPSNQSLSAWDYSDNKDYQNNFEYQNAFVNALGYEDLYTIIPLEDDPNKINEYTSYCFADTSNLVKENSKETTEINISIHTAKDVSGDVYLSSANSIFYLGEAKDDIHDEFSGSILVLNDLSDIQFSIAFLNKEVLEAIYNELNSFTMNNVTKTFDGITGTIAAPNNGTVYISLPLINGWKAYVDGVETPIDLFLGGMGISVTEGTHTIELKYFPPAFISGACVTIITIIGVIFYFGVIPAKKKKKNLKKH